ncbi:MAG: hypothetical protein ABIK28_05285 [Planctomycetota bacterium]
MIRKITIFVMALFLCRGVAQAVDPGEKVKEGIRLFQSGDLEGAGKAFDDADVALPDDLRIAFDRACVFAGMNDTDKAIEFLQKAALSRDETLAIAAHFNLGAVAAACAKTLFGEQPEDATPEIRQEGLEQLNRAVRHYRDCLDLNTNHEDARHNLELIRLWIKHMEAVWKEKDRQKTREEMDLLQFLEMIENRQLGLLAACRNLAQETDSPLRRQALDETADAQRELADEITPLKEKIEQALQAQLQGAGGMPGPQPGAAAGGAGPGGMPGMDPEQIKKLTELIEEMKGWADESGAAMQEVAGFIPASPEEASPRQKQAVDSLRRIFDIVAPYPTTVQKSLQTEQAIVNSTSPLVETPEEAGKVHFDDLSWQQERIAKLSDVMAFKAKEGLKTMEAQEAQSTDPSQPQPPRPVAPGTDPDEAKKQQEGLKKSMEIAVARCPEVHTLASSAAESLGKQDAPAALPDEEKALKILKEIAEPLPKNDEQQQNQNQQNKEQQEQENKEEQEQKDQGEQEQEQQQDLSRQQAEDLLQKAKEREKEGREKEEQARRTLIQPGKVDKDW